MSIELCIFTMLTHFAGYESVHFRLYYAAKNEPTGAAWGLMHIAVMDGSKQPFMISDTLYCCYRP